MELEAWIYSKRMIEIQINMVIYDMWNELCVLGKKIYYKYYHACNNVSTLVLLGILTCGIYFWGV